jgi:hypothetical protein
MAPGSPLRLIALFILMAALVMLVAWVLFRRPPEQELPAAIGGGLAITAFAAWRAKNPRRP